LDSIEEMRGENETTGVLKMGGLLEVLFDDTTRRRLEEGE
jgi:hypothetical protein